MTARECLGKPRWQAGAATPPPGSSKPWLRQVPDTVAGRAGFELEPSAQIIECPACYAARISRRKARAMMASTTATMIGQAEIGGPAPTIEVVRFI